MKKDSRSKHAEGGNGAARNLRLVPTEPPSTTSNLARWKTTPRRDPRDLLVERARHRLASGYYGRPEVVERLVELLWDEFYTR